MIRAVAFPTISAPGPSAAPSRAVGDPAETSSVERRSAPAHLRYEQTLARAATFCSDPQRQFTATLTRMMLTNHLGYQLVASGYMKAAKVGRATVISLAHPEGIPEISVETTAITSLNYERDDVGRCAGATESVFWLRDSLISRSGAKKRIWCVICLLRSANHTPPAKPIIEGFHSYARFRYSRYSRSDRRRCSRLHENTD